MLVLCATVVFASCSKDDPVTEPVPEGITVTTYDALLDALQTGGTSADAPTLVTLGGNITIPAGGDYTTPPMNGSGHFKIDGGGHTMTWEDGNNYHFLGNFSPDADAVYIELTNINLVQQDIKSAVCVINGRITLGKDVALTMNGQYGDMIVAVGEKAVLELGEGFELSCTAVSSSCCVIVQEGATLVLNGGKTAAGAYIDLNCDFTRPPPIPLSPFRKPSRVMCISFHHDRCNLHRPRCRRLPTDAGGLRPSESESGVNGQPLWRAVSEVRRQLRALPRPGGGTSNQAAPEEFHTPHFRQHRHDLHDCRRSAANHPCRRRRRLHRPQADGRTFQNRNWR